MKIIFILVLMIGAKITYTEPQIRIFHETSSDGYEIYADNYEPCPVSIELNLTLSNLDCSLGDNKIIVIPANSSKVFIAKLTIQNQKKPYNFTYKFLSNIGDHNQKIYQKDFIYHLPYTINGTYKINQGYGGELSHQALNALDFSFPEGTPITAIRGGIVVRVVDQYNEGCPRVECAQYNNYITIYHEDGTFADYLHLQQNGASVSVGQTVQQGEVIGVSGNTGWTSGPHLHIEVFLQKIRNRETLLTKFLLKAGQSAQYLEEGKQYTREY